MQTTNKNQENNLRKQFEKEGYIVVKNFFSEKEMTTLMNDIKSAKSRNGVSGIDRDALTFYSSLFFHSKPIQSFISQQRIIDLLTPIIGSDIWVRWDQAVVKDSGAGIFPWHQDNAYSDLKDGYYQLWIAITEMSPDNGGLWLVPGSHKQLLPHRKTGNHLEWEGSCENAVFIAAEPGDVVLFSSFMLHKTNPNMTKNPRWAYVIEYMSVEHFDPGVEPPYFIISRNGLSQPEFVNFYRGCLKPINHL
ncbi:MAG: phytanoyl-CoA dioxygenase family protein, partial [Microcoleaceae cyanobacterium MO_207.B10]|nr:phytanoyl-CoA dioxygenase family protein [Microcoleaceae cyanobacterium MO_207.B10]